jgi:hypothetical protein
VGIANPTDPTRLLFKPVASYAVLDVHTVQKFALPASQIIAVRAVFSDFYDFYGRVMVYHERVIGRCVSAGQGE